MTSTDWFRLRPDADAPAVEESCFDKKKYPYFTDAESFDAIDHSVVLYEREKFSPCDMLFVPTFLIGDKLLALFELLEPSLQFKGVQMYRKFKPAEAPRPMFWVPYLPFTDALDEKTQVVQGKAVRLTVKLSTLSEKRVAHCRLPADDIWLLSLEAAECLLRRQPIGVVLEKVFTQP